MSAIDATIKNILHFSTSPDVREELKTVIVKDCVKGLTANALNMFQNITETSINAQDYEIRINEMCARFGLQKASNKFF